MEHELTEHLTKVAAAYCKATGLKPGTVGRRMFGSDRFLTNVATGASFTVRLYDNAMQRFSDNWPADAEWPSDVPRPQPSDKQGDASC